jgi:membrane-associated phospholipid phosphatase
LFKNIFLIFIFSFPALFPQAGEKFEADFYDLFRTGGEIVTSPLSFDNKDWLNFAGTIALTAGIFFIDEDVRDIGRKNNNDFNSSLFRIDKYYYIEFEAVTSFLIYGYGLFSGNDNIRKTGFDLGTSLFYTGLVTAALKAATGRTRSTKNDPNNIFKPFNVPLNDSSFPSAHTSLSFAFSTVMAHQIDNIFWKAGWFTASGLVGAARIYNDKHWLSDVLFGAAIGYFIGDYVVHRNVMKNDFSFYFLNNEAGIIYNF